MFIYVHQIKNKVIWYQKCNVQINSNDRTQNMRGYKNTHSKRERVKIPLLPNNVGKRAGQHGHNNYQSENWKLKIIQVTLPGLNPI